MGVPINLTINIFFIKGTVVSRGLNCAVVFLPLGEPGLLISPVTSRNPFLGYAGGRELSEAKLLRGVFANGDVYFNSGDLMVQDAEGFISFWDRTGDTYR